MSTPRKGAIGRNAGKGKPANKSGGGAPGSSNPESSVAGRMTDAALKGIYPYLLFGAVILFQHIIYDPTTTENAPVFPIIAALFVAGVFLYLWAKTELSCERVTALVIMMGVLVRLAYAHNTSAYVRQHDLGTGQGFFWQLDYILHFVNNWTLPDTNEMQFYHPPLHHFISAMWLRINNASGAHYERGVESLQYLAVFYSSCFMVVANRIFARLKLKKEFLLTATALIAFHPAMILLSGSINNDTLSILFYASAILWMMKWWETQSIKNTLFLALSVGLGMMTKMGNTTLAFVIAPFFLIKLIGEKGYLQRLVLSAKLALFGLVSVPLGMWHAVRNLIEFGQPFGYVLTQEVGGIVYRGDYPTASRIFSFPLSQLFKGPFADLTSDYNLPTYILKCSLFGEWNHSPKLYFFASVLIALNIILIAMSLAAMVYVLSGKWKAEKWMLFALWLVQMVSFVWFNIQYPFFCCMNFRYIVPTLICGAGFICLAGQRIADERAALWKKARIAVFSPIILFAALSAIFSISI